MLPFLLFPVGQEFGNHPAGQFWLEPPMQLQVVAGVGASGASLGPPAVSPSMATPDLSI